MSAYMVDREHIRYLVDAAMSYRLRGMSGSLRWYWKDGLSNSLAAGDYSKAALIGQMLWDENAKSIRARYPDTVDDFSNAPGPIGEDFIYGNVHHPLLHEAFDPVQVIKSCHCYSYQACEHEGWKESEAHAFIKALESAAINVLPGYDDAMWGAPEPKNPLPRCVS